MSGDLTQPSPLRKVPIADLKYELALAKQIAALEREKLVLEGRIEQAKEDGYDNGESAMFTSFVNLLDEILSGKMTTPGGNTKFGEATTKLIGIVRENADLRELVRDLAAGLKPLAELPTAHLPAFYTDESIVWELNDKRIVVGGIREAANLLQRAAEALK